MIPPVEKSPIAKTALHPRLGLAIAVTALSFPAIFIRLAEADGLSIAFLRLFWASLILWPISGRVVLPAWKALDQWGRLRVLCAGAFLGIHLFLWITSVTMTTVASAAFLIITQPIIVAVLAHFLLKERINRWVIIAVVLTLIGAGLMSGGDLQLGREYLIGDLLAFLGAIMAAFYLLAGRSVRRKIDILPYITIIYSVAALVLLPICLIVQSPIFHLSDKSYFWIFMLTAIPTLIGHSLYNWTLRYMKVFTVNIAIIAEPILATIMAWLIFAEKPGVFLYPGAMLLMLALIFAFKGEEQ